MGTGGGTRDATAPHVPTPVGMATLARREVTQHAGRLVSTLLSLVLAVGFLVTAVVFSATERQAATSRTALFATRAGIVVESHVWPQTGVADRDRALQEAEAILGKAPEITHMERFSQVYVRFTHGSVMVGSMLNSTVTDPSLQWYSTVEGRLPRGEFEIVLTRDVARRLGVGLGDTVTVDLFDKPATVVGLTQQQGFVTPPAYATMTTLRDAGHNLPPVNTNIEIDPQTAMVTTPWSSGGAVGEVVLATTRAGTDNDALAAELRRQFADAVLLHADAYSAAEERQRSSVQGFGGTRWAPWLTLGCALLALVVGGVTTATTFGVLVAQRRRQIGLLRAVGATRRQVRRRFLVEALLLGAVGALVGVPLGLLVSWLLAVRTHSIDFGLVVPWRLVGLAALAGVAASVTACLLPIRRATRVSPLEALQSAAPSATRREGVLGRMLRRLSRRPGVVRLATGNLTRTPGRSLASVLTLLAAFAPLVMVQVAAATGTQAGIARLDDRYPADLVLQSGQRGEPVDAVNGQTGGPDISRNGYLIGFTANAARHVREIPGVGQVASFRTTEPLLIQMPLRGFSVLSVMAFTDAAQPLLHHHVEVHDGQIGLSEKQQAGLQVHPGDAVDVVPYVGRQLSLTVVTANVSDDVAIATPATVASLATHVKDGLMLVRLDGTRTEADVIAAIQGRLLGTDPGLTVGGNGERKASLRRAIDSATALLQALLAGVAAVASVGVANTLGLSVRERVREIGVLRALGLPRRSVRLMLLVEALLLAAATVLLGLVVGVLAGWATAWAALHLFGGGAAPLVVPWSRVAVATVALVALTCLASVLPGRRASQVAPVTALADLG